MPSSRWRRRGIAVFVGVLVFLAILAMAAALVVPRLIEGAHLREKIATQLSRQLGGEVQLGSLHLSWLPLPHVVLEQVSLEIPGSVRATIPSTSVYPLLLPLLRGELRLGAVGVVEPDVRVELPHATKNESTVSGESSVAEAERAVASALAAASGVASSPLAGLSLTVDGGTLHLLAFGAQEFSFTRLDARVRLPAERLSLDLSCDSNLWRHLELNAAIDPVTVEGRGRIDIAGLRPELIANAALADAGVRLGESTLDLALQLGADGVGTVQAEVDGSAGEVTILRGDERLALKGDRLRATVRLGNHKGEVSLTQLTLATPPLQLSGRFAVNQTTPSAALELTASDVDISSVHDTALFLGGGSGVVAQIFDILRAGRVPQLTIQAHGRSPADLGDTDALEIRGQLVDGRVHVPGVGLDLDHVTGDAAVIQGVLTGEHIAASMGRLSAQDGTLRVGLSGTAPPLNVETRIVADASEVPSLLRRLVKSEDIGRELDRVSDITGTASGQLTLSGTTATVRTKVEVDGLDVSGRFKGAGTVLRVAGGRVTYEDGSVQADDLQMALGESSLSQVSFRAAWSEEPRSFDASAGRSTLILDKVYPWLMAVGFLRDMSADVKEITGVAAIDSLRLHGPLDVPAEWHIEMAGSARNFAIDSPHLLKRITLRSPVMLSNIRLIRDAAQTELSGDLVAPDGLRGAVDLVWNHEELDIRRLRVRDAQSDASLSLLMAEKEIALNFKGMLTKSTIDSVIEGRNLLGGSIRGDFRVNFFGEHPERSTMEGKLEAEDVFWGRRGVEPLRIQQLSVSGSANTLDVDMAIEAGQDSHPHLHGTVARSAKGLVASFDLGADHLDWSRLEPLIVGGPEDDEGVEEETGAARVPWRGTVRVTAQSLTFHGYTWKPLQATVKLSPPRYTVMVDNAALCGIATPGKIDIGPRELELRFRPAAKEQPLDPALTCLFNDKGLVTGSFDLTGEVTAKSPLDDVMKALHGRVNFGATNGRIYRMAMIARAFSLLSIATGSVENLRSLGAEGLAYDRIGIEGDVQGTTFSVKHALLDGPTTKLACDGSIDMAQQRLDLTLLVAPLRSVDSILSRLPVFDKILGGSLVSVPVKVSGPLSDPEVVPLDPSLVGREMLGFMKRTLKLPIEVLQPLLPGGSAEKK